MHISGVNMDVREVEQEEAEYYCSKEEDHFFDKKSYKSKGSVIEKIAVALSNADGGQFVVGIDDDKVGGKCLDRWRGYSSIEDANYIVKSLVHLRPSLEFRAEFLKIKGAINTSYVVLINVDKNLHVCETSSREVFIRKGPQSLELKGEKIVELTHAKGIASEEDVIVKDFLVDELESSLILRNYLEEIPITDKDPLTFLIQENLIGKVCWTPKIASVLMFAENPSQILSKQCAVKVVRYETDDDDINRDRLKESISVEGCVYHIIKKAFDAVKIELGKNIFKSIDGDKVARYPDEALWEIIVNCIIHRDYSISDNVKITIFFDRIEFLSPGRLPGFVTPKNILDHRFSRNSKIVRLLSKYPNSPNKDLGEGMNTVYQRMRESGFTDPFIAEEGNYLKVVLSRKSSDNPRELIISYIMKFGEVTNKIARELTCLDAEQVTRIFLKLKDDDFITKKNSSSTAKTVWIKV